MYTSANRASDPEVMGRSLGMLDSSIRCHGRATHGKHGQSKSLTEMELLFWSENRYDFCPMKHIASQIALIHLMSNYNSQPPNSPLILLVWLNWLHMRHVVRDSHAVQQEVMLRPSSESIEREPDIEWSRVINLFQLLIA